MNAKQEVARRIRAARLERGLTQAEVAQALGLHRPSISEVEAGRRSVTSDELATLSAVFDVPVGVLVPGTPFAVADHSSPVRKAILDMARVIAERFAPEAVILFGSHARGTPDTDSDVDLLVVMDVEGSKRRLGARIGAALHDFPLPKDIVVTTPEAYRRRRDVPGTIERSAALEGDVLYASG